MRRMWSRSTRAPTGPSWLNCRARSTTSGCTRQCADLGLAIGPSLQAVAAAAGGAAQKTKRIQLRSADKIIRHPGEGRDPPLYLRAVDLWISGPARVTNGR